MYELHLLETPLCAHWEVSVRVCLPLYVCVCVCVSECKLPILTWTRRSWVGSRWLTPSILGRFVRLCMQYKQM